MTIDSPRLSALAREVYTDPGNEVFLSAASVWEIAVKHAMGRLPLPEPPDAFIPARRKAYGIQSLPMGEQAALHVSRLPRLHADPFDRMLICQAIVHSMALLTPDPSIAQYSIRVLW